MSSHGALAVTKHLAVLHCILLIKQNAGGSHPMTGIGQIKAYKIPSDRIWHASSSSVTPTPYCTRRSGHGEGDLDIASERSGVEAGKAQVIMARHMAGDKLQHAA